MISAVSQIGNKAERFPAEIWDQMQFFFQEYNDHQLHAVIYFNNLLNRESLKKAALLSMDIVPLLSSRFVLNGFRPYWERDHYDENEIISFIDTLNPDEEISIFITGLTNELTGPQIMMRVIRFSGKDALCIVMNHMVCDGAGFKEYLYLLAKLYTHLDNGTYDSFEYFNGSRNALQIYRHFGLATRLKLLFLPNEPLQNKNNIYFPLSRENGTPVPHIFLYKLPPEYFRRLKQYGKKYGVTVNDIVLAAFYRALFKIIEIPEGESLVIPCMVDLRRYLPAKKADGICNLSSMIMCNIGPELGADPQETVQKVHRAMNKKKNGYPGMHGLATLNLLFGLLPFSSVRKIIKKEYVNPLIGITNIGIIDSEKLRFGSVPVADAFVTGSIKYPLYFQLALTSFKDSLTFSINLYSFKKDTETIKRFYAFLEEELKALSALS